jgi:hypothetical protein
MGAYFSCSTWVCFSFSHKHRAPTRLIEQGGTLAYLVTQIKSFVTLTPDGPPLNHPVEADGGQLDDAGQEVDRGVFV